MIDLFCFDYSKTTHLIENGFEIRKSRTTVGSIIKKINKREDFLSQTIFDRIKSIFIQF